MIASRTVALRSDSLVYGVSCVQNPEGDEGRCVPGSTSKNSSSTPTLRTLIAGVCQRRPHPRSASCGQLTSYYPQPPIGVPAHPGHTRQDGGLPAMIRAIPAGRNPTSGRSRTSPPCEMRTALVVPHPCPGWTRAIPCIAGGDHTRRAGAGRADSHGAVRLACHVPCSHDAEPFSGRM
jgi:hypothetical protein